jgi:hypothetical protein
MTIVSMPLSSLGFSDQIQIADSECPRTIHRFPMQQLVSRRRAIELPGQFSACGAYAMRSAMRHDALHNKWTTNRQAG